MSAVGATISGDRYQARLFWYFASQLLYDRGIVQAELESVETKVFDDITIQYDKPKWLGQDRWCSADYYQAKYHVDMSGCLSAGMFTDPSASRTKHPLLRRFFDAHQKTRLECNARLNLITNWAWDTNDPLAECFRRSRFSNEHVDKSKGARDAVAAWKKFLNCGDADFEMFLAYLTIKSSFSDLDDLQERLNDRLRLAGLKPLHIGVDISPYDDLGLNLMERGITRFDRVSLLRECQGAGLVERDAENMDSGRTIAIRSFSDGSQDVQAAILIELADLFVDKRVPIDGNVWSTTVPTRLRDGLSAANIARVSKKFIIRLDCQLSVAFLAGRMLSPKAGYEVDVLQKGRDGVKVWCSADGRDVREATWNVVEPSTTRERDLYVSVALTRDTHADVKAFAETVGRPFELMLLSAKEIGQTAVRDSAHAWGLAESLVNEVRAVLRKYADRPRVHLFLACPNAFAFRLGQESALLGEIQLYEFGFERGQKYSASLTAPAG